MRKSLENDLRLWSKMAVRKTLISPRWEGELFVTAIKEHKNQGLHWYDRAMAFLGEGTRARQQFERDFGPMVTGSLLRDLKNIEEVTTIVCLKDISSDGEYARHLLRTHRKRQRDQGDRMNSTAWVNRSLLELPSLRGKLVSVEVEYYGRRLADTRFHRTGNDGSLTERDDGAEFRLTTWGAESAVRQLTKLAKNGALFGANCGLHVHVDMRDMSEGATYAVWHALQCRFEAVIKKLVPASRLSNRYCSFSNRDRYQRYSAWNMVCWDTKKTLEWRMQGPLCRTDWRLDASWQERVATWMRVCQHITRTLALDYVANGGEFSLLPKSPTDRAISWTRFLSLLPEDLREWCEVRAGRLEASKIKSRAAQSAIVGDAIGPVPCCAAGRRADRQELGPWHAYLNEHAAARFIRTHPECGCPACNQIRASVLNDVRAAGLLCQSIVDDLFPVMHTTARVQVACSLANDPSPDAMTRLVPCVRGLLTTPAWVLFRIRRSLREGLRQGADNIAWQAALSECQCGACRSARERALRAIVHAPSFNHYVSGLYPMPRLGHAALALLNPFIDAHRRPAQTELPLPESSNTWIEEIVRTAESLPASERVTITPGAQRVTPIRDISLEELAADRQATSSAPTIPHL